MTTKWMVYATTNASTPKADWVPVRKEFDSEAEAVAYGALLAVRGVSPFFYEARPV